jgi:hypothetical protein
MPELLARTPCESNPLHDTFSVPVFQWLSNADRQAACESTTTTTVPDWVLSPAATTR